MKKRELILNLIIFIFILSFIFVGFKLYKEQKRLNQKEIEISNKLLKIKEQENKINLIEKKLKEEKEKNKLEFLKIKAEWEKLKTYEKRINEKEEKFNREKRWIKDGIWYYSKNHKIKNSEDYPEINIEDNFSHFFAIVETKKNDTYTKLLTKVFGYKNWNKLSKEERSGLEDLAEKINRLDRKRLQPNLKLVIPFDKLALSYSPFEKTLDSDFVKLADFERNKKIKYYWNGFGSNWGNKTFQKRAEKEYQHILLVDLKKQYFGLYKNGILEKWGPVSTSDKEHETPRGFFISLWYHPDWYSKKYEAEMKNAVNFDPEGYFTHTGAILGAPRSHGCVRMLDNDSKTIYDIATEEVFPIVIQ